MVLLDWLRRNWLRALAHAGSLAPLAWILWTWGRGAFLVDPVREITTLTGRTALILLLLSLSVTPAGTVFGYRRAALVRRPLGLYAFLYASLHFATFLGLDYGFDWSLIVGGILDQRYVLVGVASGLLMVPLAVTSTKGWQRRLGKRWKLLHRLVYLSAGLAVIHFFWLVKDIRVPVQYGLVLAGLLLLRLPPIRRSVAGLRRRLGMWWHRATAYLARSQALGGRAGPGTGADRPNGPASEY
jgi:sulfoxide reductase heme-binding subunit YedZ